ncbi:Peptidyl-prolyl cis-trans isomerase FKBP16-4, chloroplastic [Prunus dulcis]|uniref:peptidylprolyl isomerase n=1 Tax=Prunus dulcis TaxID=3755 RepID=A0A4Y1RV09_PRUDU|nr:Peptidyl-prolyl cis-trans isomerase FKBP16-4, chloroplastic [Prunus dulcis]
MKMESSTSKVEVIIKPMLLKTGIPLALSVVGFICAKLMAKRSLNPKESLSEADDQVLRDGDSFHSFSSTCVFSMEDHEPIIMDANVMNLAESLEIGYNKHELEEEISFLRIGLDDLQNRESELEMQFIHYCDLKEKKSVVVELRNMLLLEMAHVEFFNREFSSMEAESQRLQKLVVEYLRILEQLEYWKSENGFLQRKVKKLLRKASWQSRIMQKQDLKLEAWEAEVLRIYDVLETRTKVIKKLEDEVGERRVVLDQVQDEKNVPLEKLELAEKSASSISKELVYLRWSNACLRHELMRNQAQEEQQDQEKNNNLATDFEGSGEIADYGLASMVLEHNEPCFGIVSGDQACLKRQKLFQRLRRLVEGSDKAKGRRLGEKERHEEVKCFGRQSVSADAEAHHIARRQETPQEELTCLTMSMLIALLRLCCKTNQPLRGAKIPESEFTTLPNGLKYYDLKVGSGAAAVTGSRVAVHYVAKWKGITFMTSRQGLGVGGGTPYGFDVGQSERGSVLKGLDLGVKGMKVGGQRLLIVPPELAYGSKGVQEIPPNATIELDVELLAIKQSPFGSPSIEKNESENGSEDEIEREDEREET